MDQTITKATITTGDGTVQELEPVREIRFAVEWVEALEFTKEFFSELRVNPGRHPEIAADMVMTFALGRRR